MKNMSNIFDCPKNIEKSIEIISTISSLLIDFGILWDDYESILSIMDKMKNTEWWNLDPGPLEEIKKSLFLIFRFFNQPSILPFFSRILIFCDFLFRSTLSLKKFL